METTEYLSKVKRLIEFFKVNEWTKYSLASDVQGTPCDVYSESAKCFCLSGGWIKLNDSHEGFLIGMALEGLIELSRDIGNIESIPIWNDNVCTSKEMLLETLQSIVDKYEKEEAKSS